MVELYWDSNPGCNYEHQKAKVTSLATANGEMVIQFKGLSRGVPYQGVVRLPLCTTERPGSGVCRLGENDVPFRLSGAFLDDKFTSYEGTWFEDPDYVATFTFDTGV